MGDKTKTMLLIVLTLIVGSSLGGLAFAALNGDHLEVKPAWEEDPKLVADWCENIGAGLDRDSPFQSFRSVADAAIEGSLRAPKTEPPTGSVQALDEWQQAHAPYITSSYLLLLKGYPKELTMAALVFSRSIEEAHTVTKITYSSDLRRAATVIDDYRHRTC